jgi:hypothetical protein
MKLNELKNVLPHTLVLEGKLCWRNHTYELSASMVLVIAEKGLVNTGTKQQFSVASLLSTEHPNDSAEIPIHYRPSLSCVNDDNLAY